MPVPSKLVCPCYHLSLDELVGTIREKKLKKLEELEKVTWAGTACGFCISKLMEILRQVNKRTK